VRILALVPARGGSKRLPGKNARLLHGKPLIVWSIESAKGAPGVYDVLVSTDDSQIAEIARDAGALVPWLRPGDLATDTATSVDVALHALSWYEADCGPVDGLLLLQPTSPFRTRDSISRAITMFREHGQRPVVSVSAAVTHPLWCYRIDGDRLRPFVEGAAPNPARSQDLPPAFALNGSIYLIQPRTLRKEGTFLTDDVVPLVMNSPREALDIDHQGDWDVAVASGSPVP
jgi:CMP-N,N'-diacetyllegionaminic acid synthase